MKQLGGVRARLGPAAWPFTTWKVGGPARLVAPRNLEEVAASAV
jgi:hypothetical protein